MVCSLLCWLVLVKTCFNCNYFVFKDDDNLGEADRDDKETECNENITVGNNINVETTNNDNSKKV